MKKKKSIKTSKKPAAKKTKSKTAEKMTLRCNPDIVFREEGKEALLFDPSTGSIKVLNYVGKMIWKLLNGKNTKEDIQQKIEKKFKDAGSKTISKDLTNFLKSLEGYGYLGKEL